MDYIIKNYVILVYREQAGKMAAPPVYSQQAHGYPQPVVMAPPVPLGAYYANPPAPQQIVMVGLV